VNHFSSIATSLRMGASGMVAGAVIVPRLILLKLKLPDRGGVEAMWSVVALELPLMTPPMVIEAIFELAASTVSVDSPKIAARPLHPRAQVAGDPIAATLTAPILTGLMLDAVAPAENAGESNFPTNGDRGDAADRRDAGVIDQRSGDLTAPRVPPLVIVASTASPPTVTAPMLPKI